MARMKAGPNKQAAGEIVRRVTDDLVRQIHSIKALWLAVHNDPNHSIQDLAVEFYGAVRDLFEGKALDQIEFQNIDPKRVARHFKEG